MPATKKRLNYAVPALEKGLDILEILSNSSSPIGLSDLAQQFGRTRNEIFRMLNCLEERGYIRRDLVSGGYQLTLKIYQLAHGHTPIEKLLEAAAIPMRELSHALNESCHLSVLHDQKVVVVAQSEAPTMVHLSVEVGGTFSAFTTVSGRLLMAFLSEEELSTMIKKEKKRDATQSLPEVLKKIRESKISVARDETIKGVHDIATLIGAPKAGFSAALAVSFLGRQERNFKEEEIVQLLKKTATQINQALGLN
ncbi:MAG: IclR family transcriptional regulator [Chthoniobacterales bacterium]